MQAELDMSVSEATDFTNIVQSAASVKFTMIVSIDEKSRPSSRPFTTQEIDTDGCAWFFTSDKTELAREVALNPNLLLNYVDSDKGRYMVLTGTGALVRDKSKVDKLWSPLMLAFFPQGKDSADLCLLKVDVERAEVWEPNGTKIGQFLKMASAALGVDVRPGDVGHHGTARNPAA